MLCAQGGGGFNFYAGYFLDEMESNAWIGRNYLEKNDSIRNWVHWRESNDKRVLQCLDLGGRKQSEWDDHKEEYPLTLDGPHVYGTFKVPAGQYVVSLYFFNKDGHTGHNRLRDYVASIRTTKIPDDLFEMLGKPNADAEQNYFRSARGDTLRIKDFWGGVYKRFYVEVGKDELVVFRLDASYSFNTIISSVLFDPAEPVDLEHFFDPSPPPRKPTLWEEVLQEIQPDTWWGIKSIDHLLCLRDTASVEYYPNVRRKLLPLIRTFIDFAHKTPTSLKTIHTEDKKRIRSDVAELLGDIQMFEVQDKIDFGNLKHGQYMWQERTKLGRGRFHEFQWDETKFQEFLKTNQQHHTW